MDARSFIARLQAGRHYRGQIAAVRELPARAADFRQPTTPLPTTLQTLLAADGINALYRHQADAYDAIRAGRHVVIATGTASGKSLCNHLPVLATLLDDTSARARYLFPAKALAYDQLGSLERLIEQGGLAERARPACYDGDTATHKRPGVRRNANILLSNPDMLHQGILPYHAKWAGFFAGLRFVVLDEIHTYRGISAATSPASSAASSACVGTTARRPSSSAARPRWATRANSRSALRASPIWCSSTRTLPRAAAAGSSSGTRHGSKIVRQPPRALRWNRSPAL
jgi:hypothetical protein